MSACCHVVCRVHCPRPNSSIWILAFFLWPHQKWFLMMFQQIVSIGIFVLVVVFVNVLLVIDSPIDGAPCDELEWGWPFVVFSVHRPLFEVHMRFMAVRTWGSKIHEMDVSALGSMNRQQITLNNNDDDKAIIFLYGVCSISQRKILAIYSGLCG